MELKVGDMVERYLEKNREMGQALVEWALVFPVFLLLVCGIIDFCWIGYQQLMFESSFQMTAWDFTLNLSLTDKDILGNPQLPSYGTYSPGNVVGTYALGEGIKQHMLQGATGFLKEDKLNVSDASAQFRIESKRESYMAGTTPIVLENYELLVDLEGELEYRVELLTPISRIFIPSGEVVLKKKLVRERIERVVVKRRVAVPL